MKNREMKDTLKKLCLHCRLGEMNEAPASVSGGLLHKIFAVRTTKGKYAIKLLNPEIMKRTDAPGNYRNSEIIASSLGRKVPALSAKEIDGSHLQKFQNHYYLVYDWLEGKTKQLSKLDFNDSETIGELLGEIHTADLTELNITDSHSHSSRVIDWDSYLRKGIENNSTWLSLYSTTIESLYKWSKSAAEAAEQLSDGRVISHRDFDPKNVRWTKTGPVIIDWESAGFIHPMQDLLETALYWSEDGEDGIQKERFFAFISGYQKHGKELSSNWKTVLDAGFSAKLDWLEYNLKRSLWIECGDKEEQQLGTEQICETIDALRKYEEKIPLLSGWLTD
ncbi:aminoglycoside phosphotransferase family protein [Rossellomorea vietnamensis]|uniref:Aminoglycoside phosphotransferase family protein n=1 Tax=Rossellomorea vietnamensis TaxID=218284 RepID=A0A5D4NS29_9BACI|nr:aminoglycoside phosphotransferase family protein [Rossellomorea vietnamensis]TYS16689.1 aminoglycoside phosphotransferase family protein [Rossellomorea vietnamensis]